MSRGPGLRTAGRALLLWSIGVLWHDVAVYRTLGSTRLAGPTYAVTSYATREACESGQGVARAREAGPREGPGPEGLPDGIRVWDPDRQHYTTLRYACWPADAGLPRFQ